MTEKINPYIAGAPVVESSLFFGRNDVFSWITRTLMGKYVDHILVIHGQRRVGKTSVLKQLPKRLPENYIQVFLDLQGRISISIDRFMWWMAREITKSLHSHAIDLAAPNLEAFSQDPDYFESKFLLQLNQALGEKKLLLTFDEFDSLDSPTAREGLALPLLTTLQHLMDHGKMAFIFSIGSSGRKLENMQAAYTDFFKQGLYKKISFLNEDDAKSLVTKPVAGVLEYTPDAIPMIYQITSGHPYYIQLICHELFSTCQKVDRWVVSRKHVEDVLDQVIERGTVNLKYIWDEAPLLGKWILGLLAQAEPCLSEEGLWTALNQERLHFSRSDLTSELLRLQEKDILTQDNRFVVQLMRLWMQRNRPIERIREELVETNPIANRFIEIGEEYKDQSEYSLAVENFNKALAVDPENLRAWLNLGFTALKQQLYEQAAQNFEKVLALDEEDVLARNGLCQVNLAQGVAAQRKGEIKNAAAYYQQVLKLDGEHEEARQRLRDLDQAQENYTQAELALKRKDYAQAINLLKEVILVSESYKNASNLLAQAVVAQRRNHPAWLNWRLVISLFGLGIIILTVWLITTNLDSIHSLVSQISSFAQIIAPNSTRPQPTITATVIPIIQPTPVPAWVNDFAKPILQSLENAQPTFEDDFSQINPDWGELPTGGYVRDGVWFYSGLGTQFGGYSLQAEDYMLEYGLISKSSQDLFWGIEFQSAISIGYEFTMAINGSSISASPNDWQFKRNGEIIASGKTLNMLQGKANYLRLISQDSQLAIYLNSNPLTYIEDNHAGWGSLQFICSSPNDNGQVEFELDNVRFWNLDPAWISNAAQPIFHRIANEQPGLVEDFSQPNRAWTQFDPNLRIYNGVLEYQGTGVWISPVDFQQVQDFVLQFDLISNSASSSLRLGTAFRGSEVAGIDPPGYYEFYLERINQDESPVIGLQKSGASIDFALFNGSAPLLELGKAMQVTLMVENNRIMLFLDGRPITYQEDDTWDSGYMRIFLGSREGEPPVQLQIDNLKYWNLEPDWMTNFVKPILQSIAAQPPKFEDDFVQSRSGWEQALEAGAQIVDGVLSCTGPKINLAFSNQFTGHDFVLQYIVTPRTGNQIQQMSLAFRYSIAGFYYFDYYYNDPTFDYNNGWGLSKIEQISESEINNTELSRGEFSRLITGQPNLVTLIAQGNQFGILINGRPVGYAQDSQWLGNDIFMGFQSMEQNKPIQVEIDDLKFWDLDF